MAKSTKPAPVETAEEEKGAEDYTTYLTKPATELQERFGEWIRDKTGYDPAQAKSKAAAFEEGVKFAVFLRIPFQKSAENQEHRAKRAAEPKPAKAEKAPKPEPIEVESTSVPAPKKAGKKGKVVAAAEPADTTVTEAAPATRKGPRKSTLSKVAPF